MKTTKHTLSLCATCYLEIPATITTDERGAIMRKTCPHHGATESMVERDPLYYLYASGLKAQSIYGGHFVDVTRTCQLRCSPCYYNLEKSDPLGMFSIEAIVNECATNINRAPFILTGGEPTLHPEFLDVVNEVSKVGPVELLSNGIKLSDAEFFNDVIPMITDRNGVTHLNLSIHHKESDDWKTVIKLARADKIRIESALIVVNSEIEFDKALDMCREMADVVNTFRIKAASRIWNAQQTSERVCVSDMLRWLEKFEKPIVHVAMQNNKPCFFNVLFDRMHLMLVSWYDVTNVDLLEIDCPPTYRARNGEVCNFVTTALINEGMEKKWMKGNRIL